MASYFRDRIRYHAHRLSHSDTVIARLKRSRRGASRVLSVLLLSVVAGAAPSVESETLAAEATESTHVDLQAIFAGGEPNTISDLKAMQKHQQKLAASLMQVTVGVVVGPAHGSGVIISEDGYVLTAAHVAGAPRRRAEFILADGRRVRGQTLGVYRTLDAGLMKIDTPGPWPFAKMAKRSDIKVGQWCVATGHPGGYEDDRKPVVRIGRVLLTDKFAITTDCTLVGGDSGGPLFDMNGQVIGINSRIGRFLTANMHVPIAAYDTTWDRLVQGDAWGHFLGTGPYIGVQGEASSAAAKIRTVYPDAPAEKAGLQPGDIVLRFGGKPVTDFASLQLRVSDHQPGEKVAVVISRSGEEVELELVIGHRDED